MRRRRGWLRIRTRNTRGKGGKMKAWGVKKRQKKRWRWEKSCRSGRDKNQIIKREIVIEKKENK